MAYTRPGVFITENTLRNIPTLSATGPSLPLLALRLAVQVRQPTLTLGRPTSRYSVTCLSRMTSGSRFTTTSQTVDESRM